MGSNNEHSSQLGAANRFATHIGGFRSQQEEIHVAELPVEGAVPEWLQGSLIRTGPANWEVGDQSMRHWFDGLAMLHRFGFDAGRVSYANRFLQTRAYRATVEKGSISYSEFATDPCRSIFSRVFSAFVPKVSDNANVNVVELGKRFLAMTETPLPVEFDRETLETTGVAYKAPGLLTTAHPHLDRPTGSLLNFAAKVGPRNRYRFFRVPPDSSRPELVAELPVDRPAYMHSFGLTERWLVLVEFPFVVNPIEIPLRGRPYIENFRWRPERGTRLTLVDRTDGKIHGPFEADACFAFHHVNAYDVGEEAVIDLCAYPDPSVVFDLYMQRLRAGKPVATAELRRFRVDPSRGTVDAEAPLTDGALELPRINYPRCNERDYRFIWGVRDAGSGWFDTIVRIDLQNHAVDTWSSPGCFPGEPVFVAAPSADEEDEGILLSIVFDANDGDSFLLILDAATLELEARVRVPHHIPYGFHGQFAH